MLYHHEPWKESGVWRNWCSCKVGVTLKLFCGRDSLQPEGAPQAALLPRWKSLPQPYAAGASTKTTTNSPTFPNTISNGNTTLTISRNTPTLPILPPLLPPAVSTPSPPQPPSAPQPRTTEPFKLSQFPSLTLGSPRSPLPSRWYRHQNHVITTSTASPSATCSNRIIVDTTFRREASPVLSPPTTSTKSISSQ